MIANNFKIGSVIIMEGFRAVVLDVRGPNIKTLKRWFYEDGKCSSSSPEWDLMFTWNETIKRHPKNLRIIL